jgi:ribonuclease HI
MAEPALLTIHTDGASRGNPGPAAFAYVIARDGEEPIEEAGKLGRMTNNQAEYLALVRALEHSLELGDHHRVVVHSDSELLVKQMKGEYRVKNADLRDLYEEASALCGRFKEAVDFRHVRREDNRRADALGNEALDGLREPTPRASNTPRAAESGPLAERAALADAYSSKNLTPPKPLAERAAHHKKPLAERAANDLREEALSHLRQAASAWSSGAAEPTPEQVWDQLLALLERHGRLAPPVSR